MLFSKGDVRSVSLLCFAFEKFSKASGLKMNKQKSSFYSNGVTEETIDKVTRLTGINRVQLHFNYLGVNISPKRLSLKDCNVIVEKIVGRIRGIGIRKLACAGRVVVERTFIRTLHRYWAEL